MKTAFLFPGQGSQKVGMVQDLFENYDSVKALIKEADETLGFSISKMMFEGPDTELMKTEFTQPAILTASVAVWQVLKEHGLTPDIAAGHSLGEYSALVAAGAISFADAVNTVHLRGRFMQEAVPLGEGGMAAVIGSTPETIVKVCGEVSTEDLPVQAVNFNCPGQVVIAGATAAVEKACEALKEAGARRAIMLKVSAPFHSTLMEQCQCQGRDQSGRDQKESGRSGGTSCTLGRIHPEYDRQRCRYDCRSRPRHGSYRLHEEDRPLRTLPPCRRCSHHR